MALPTVDTFPAGGFVCPECGRTNLYNLVPVGEGMAKDFTMDMLEIAGYPEDIRLHGIIAREPEVVECHGCGLSFTPYHDDEDDL